MIIDKYLQVKGTWSLTNYRFLFRALKDVVYYTGVVITAYPDQEGNKLCLLKVSWAEQIDLFG